MKEKQLRKKLPIEGRLSKTDAAKPDIISILGTFESRTVHVLKPQLESMWILHKCAHSCLPVN